MNKQGPSLHQGSHGEDLRLKKQSLKLPRKAFSLAAPLYSQHSLGTKPGSAPSQVRPSPPAWCVDLNPVPNFQPYPSSVLVHRRLGTKGLDYYFGRCSASPEWLASLGTPVVRQTSHLTPTAIPYVPPCLSEGLCILLSSQSVSATQRSFC